MTAAAVQELARFVAALGPGDLPEQTVERAKLVLADTIGVALAGSAEPEMQRLYERLPAGSGSTLLRSGFDRRAPSAAAFANATATSFLELDEGTRPTGHPALHVVFPALALAQAERLPGSELVVAIVAGYEVQARLARACRLRWPVHPHGNLGQPAAAAALGKLAGWEAAELERGMNGAASLAAATSWRSCFDGATTRNAYAGITAQVAFTAKMLVESGFGASEGAFAETYGTILGNGFRPEALTDGLGADFAIEHGYFKFHAACALVHPVLDALADALGAEHAPGRYPLAQADDRPPPAEIRRILVRVGERAALLSAPNLPSQLSAKFSIPYAAAAFVVRGTSGPDSFRGAALADPQILHLVERVEVEASDELSARWPDAASATVELELADGRTLAGSCVNPYGSAERPATEADLRAKFAYLTADALAEPEQERLWARALAIEALDDVSSFPGPVAVG